MKRKFRVLPLLVGLVLSAALMAIVACAQQPIQPLVQQPVQAQVTPVAGAQPTTAASQAATLELITPGELVIGFEPQPGIFEVKDGKATGLFGEMITQVAVDLGLKPVYAPFAFPALIPALQSHRIDVISAGLSITQPRAQILYYSPAWLFGPETMAVLPGTDIPTWEDAAAKKLTLATGVGYYYVPIWEELGINIHTFDSPDACYLDVVNKAAAGCAVGAFTHVQRKLLAPDGPASKLVSIITRGPRVTSDLNALGINKDAPNLARALSAGVIKLHRTGFVEETVKRNLQGAPEYQLFLQPPSGQSTYIPGPWEEGVVPPAAEVYPQNIKTVTPGVLTVGVLADSPLLKLTADGLSGPEAEILRFAASKLGLTLKAVAVTDMAAALKSGQIDVGAGALAATESASHQYWQTIPIAFNPDYIYVAPAKDGTYPSYTKWEDIQDGPIAVVAENPRIADIKATGAQVLEVADAAAGLGALVDGTAKGFVGSSLDYAVAAGADPKIAGAGIGWVRNANNYSSGVAYAWGAKWGNEALLDALNQAIMAAWQQNVISNAYRSAFPGVNTSVLLAPGPTAIGTSFGKSQDFTFNSMWVPGPWAQRPSWEQ